MSELDNAWSVLRENIRDPKNQSKFYDLFLNTSFFVPSIEPDELPAGNELADNDHVPLVLESDGREYLMLFDSRERMEAWANGEVRHVEVPGHILAATSMPPLHWALNVGTEYSKQFIPDEIAWLREVVHTCESEAAKQAEQA